MSDDPVVVREISKVLLDMVEDCQRTASITGKTLSIILSVRPDGVPVEMQQDLLVLQGKARRIYVEMQAEVNRATNVIPASRKAMEQAAPAEAEDAKPPADPEPAEAAPTIALEPAEPLPPISMPDFDGPTEQSIASLGSNYHWKLNQGADGHGKVWELAQVDPPKPRPSNEEDTDSAT